MEKEHIVKALGYCTSGGACYECQYDENPRLSREGCMARKMFNALSLIREQEKRIEEVKADTVRKMQKMLKKTFSALCKGEMIDLFRIIDQIAKQLTEDKA